MDEQSQQAWLAFVEAERVFRESMGELRHVDMVQVLREGLGYLPWRRPALVVLGSSNVGFSAQLLPELFALAGDAHALLGEVRRVILRIPRSVLEEKLPPLVDGLLANPDSDYEAYRRTAELLLQLDMRETLNRLTSAASRSSDEDIREVAADFASE